MIPGYRSRSGSRSRSRSRNRHRHSRLPSPSPFNDPTKSPQENLAEFWTRFHAKKQGKVTSIFPRSLYAPLHPGANVKDASDGPRPDPSTAVAKNAAESYDVAAKECRERVKRAVVECRRTNEKFTDPDFDIESDTMDNCLFGLERFDDLFIFGGRDSQRQAGDTSGRQRADDEQVRGRTRPQERPRQRKTSPRTSPPRPGKDGARCGPDPTPGSVHRVDWIFENPQFTVNGYSSSDIKQGSNGDCWWLAAVATIAHRPDLMNRVCVARDEACGVYGFCFFRDGEWIPVVVDDNLYLEREDFDHYGDVYDPSGKRAARHRQRYQTGSEALHFARCDDPDETWLPLLEKAYAKVHCDYAAIEGGWSSEGVEDMTGGVGTTIASSKILDKDKLWRELASSDGEFVFALSAMGTGWDRTRNGLALGHAYSVLQATEAFDEDGKRLRLVKIRNPWGERDTYGLGEWTGPWSDGSKEWTPYWLRKLSHTFGDDGVFWMSFSDMLSTFKWVHRTRLFDARWTVVSAWTSPSISWVSGFLRKKFRVEVGKAGTVIVVLSQLDDRYFVGLEGQYYFELQFVLQREGKEGGEGERVCGARQVHKWENRSISCEVELEAGVYEVVPKITASRRYSGVKTVEEMVRDYAEDNPQKVRQVGMQYDLAHAKPGVSDYDLELEKEKEKKKKKEEDKKKKEKARKRKQKERQKKVILKQRKNQKKQRERQRKEKEKAKNNAEKEAEERKRRNEARQKRREERESKEQEKKKEVEGGNKEQEKMEEEADGENKAAVTGPKTAEASELEGSSLKAADANAPESTESPEKQRDKPDGGATPDTPMSEVSKSELLAESVDAATKSPADAEAPAAPKPSDEVADDEVSDDEEIPSPPSLSEVETDTSSSSSDSELETESESESDDPPVVQPPTQQPPPNQPVSSTPPWNPVCVLGLRVYALDPDVSIKLVEVEDEKKDTKKNEENGDKTEEKKDGNPANETS